MHSYIPSSRPVPSPQPSVHLAREPALRPRYIGLLELLIASRLCLVRHPGVYHRRQLPRKSTGIPNGVFPHQRSGTTYEENRAFLLHCR